MKITATSAFATILLLSASITLPAVAHAGTTEYSYKMADMFNRLTKENATMFWIGDSTASPVNTPRWQNSVIDTWAVPWVGFVAGRFESSAGPTGGYSTFNQVSGPHLVTPGALFPLSQNMGLNGAGQTNDTLFNFHTITAPAGGTTLLNIQLSNLTSYLGGDWTRNQQVVAHIIMHGPDTEQATNTHFQLFTSAGDYIQSRHDVSIPAGTYGSFDIPFAPPNSIAHSYISMILDNGGATTAQATQVGAVEFYVPNKNGFSAWFGGVGGSHAYDWLPKSIDPIHGMYTTDQIVNAFSLLHRKINTFVIQLGINGTSDENETPSGQATYKQRIEQIIDTYQAAAEAAGGTHIKILLINPWRTMNIGSEWPQARGPVLAQIAHERTNVSFIDLNAVMDRDFPPGWQDTFLADGIHQSVAGADAFGAETWKEILTGRTTCHYLGISNNCTPLTKKLAPANFLSEE